MCIKLIPWLQEWNLEKLCFSLLRILAVYHRLNQRESLNIENSLFLPCASINILNVPSSLNWTGGISDLRNFNTASATPADSILALFTTAWIKNRDWSQKHFWKMQLISELDWKQIFRRGLKKRLWAQTSGTVSADDSVLWKNVTVPVKLSAVS